AYVSCRGYDGTLKSARFQSVKQGGTTDRQAYSSLTEDFFCRGFLFFYGSDFYEAINQTMAQLKTKRQHTLIY
ncbi:MAG: hypothetical protein IJN81_12060, partial [Clostridia bacterium]|nr:hypothetical protein [Clostridia bacterium]